MRKFIYILIVILLLVLFIKPTIQEFFAKDDCLDRGGSYNAQSQICEGARSPN
ncbi:hypothetical protein SAMN02745664_102124 [Moraxella cuniculi DSM 21768]|uniref:Uncharacterized protein n=2 Tax=Moraxella cuniculi TaxID=34061 RepID=A0A1N7DUC2_9GAMM|nr:MULTISPECIES: hypothetical protein [Gammaproteobacteria]SIR79424.1 hypothetical protein SAMN02745664_102124 [Moraxella cuniculi DSM 21768]VEG12612.1 Uncharacterised protein [Moraxella cuniculi]